MIHYITRVLLSALMIVVISEIARRSLFAGAVIASLPVVTILVFVWMYIDTGDVQRISDLSRQVFWFVISSLVLFLTLPVFIRYGVNFFIGLLSSMALTAIAYFVLVWAMRGKGLQM